MWKHKKTQPALAGLGSAALAAAVAVSRYSGPNFLKGVIKFYFYFYKNLLQTHTYMHTPLLPPPTTHACTEQQHAERTCWGGQKFFAILHAGGLGSDLGQSGQLFRYSIVVTDGKPIVMMRIELQGVQCMEGGSGLSDTASVTLCCVWCVYVCVE